MERRGSGRGLVGSWLAGALALLMVALSATSRLHGEESPGSARDPLTARLLSGLQSAELGPRARLAVYLADPATGIEYVALGADEPVPPASVMKLVTTAAALESLGPSHTFETRVEAHGVIAGNVLKGDLVIVGGGDPSLGSRFQAKPGEVTLILEDWAAAVRAKGIREVTGNVVGDDSRYVYDPHATGWEPLEFGEWYSAEVSALNFNENVIDVIWTGGKSPGDMAKFRLVPKTEYIVFASSVRTSPESQRVASIRYLRRKESNEIRARGRIAPGAEKYEFASIHDPANFTARLFLDTLAKSGVKVNGSAYSRHAGADDEPSTETVTLARHTSPPLSELVNVVNRRSQNLYAEVLLREVALRRGAGTDFADATRALTDWLREKGLHRTGFLTMDGSGLSPLDRATPRMIGGILSAMGRSPISDLYKGSLAAPGAEGSLRSRFQSADFEPIRNNLRAKTGFIAGVHSLAGYMKHKRGSEYVFFVAVTGYDTERSVEARDLLDRATLELQQSDVLP